MLVVSCNNNRTADDSMAGEEPTLTVVEQAITETGYVDLGLPSGTRWAATNEVKEDGDIYFNYDEAVRCYGDLLPTNVQWKELKDYCRWDWMGSGYVVTGPNGHCFRLPAAGNRGCNGVVSNDGADGRYWSSTPGGQDYAWRLYFDRWEVGMYYDNFCHGFSVRLVQD